MTLIDHAKNAKCLMDYVPANASGVVFSFAEWMRFACEMKLSTQGRNEHPITKAYMIGLASMMGDVNGLDFYSSALDGLKKIISEVPHE